MDVVLRGVWSSGASVTVSIMDSTGHMKGGHRLRYNGYVMGLQRLLYRIHVLLTIGLPETLTVHCSSY